MVLVDEDHNWKQHRHIPPREVVMTPQLARWSPAFNLSKISKSQCVFPHDVVSYTWGSMVYPGYARCKTSVHDLIVPVSRIGEIASSEVGA